MPYRSTNKSQNFTMIDDLFLTEGDGSSSNTTPYNQPHNQLYKPRQINQLNTHQQEIDPKYLKYIRKHYRPHHQSSGMQTHPYPQEQLQEQFQEQFQETDTQSHNTEHNCVSVSEHCQNCPVCKKLYSSDNTLYIIVIVILAVICILLVKKVIEV